MNISVPVSALDRNHSRVEPRRQRRLMPRDAGSIEAQIVATPELRRIVYKMRHDSYVAQGFLDPQASGLFTDRFDQSANSHSVLILRDGEPVASVRASILDLSGKIPDATELPATSSYGEEILKLVSGYHGQGIAGRAIEMTRLVTRHDLSLDFDLVFSLFRMTFYIVNHYDAEMILSGVRLHHTPFYRRLGFDKITEPRHYPLLNFQVCLMACPDRMYDQVARTVPIIDHVSKHDPVCAPFMAGERVRVFSQMPEYQAAA